MSQLKQIEITSEPSSSSGLAAEGFADVATSCRPHVFRFLLASLRDADLAETLTQECLLKAHSNWSSFRGESTPKTWMIRIAVNLQMDYWRSRRMQFWQRMKFSSVDLNEAIDWLPSAESSPEERASTRERVHLIWKTVEKLPERQRTVFLLRFVEDLTVHEIAEVADLKVGTVKSHLHRTLSRVRAELEQMRRRPVRPT